MKTFLVTIGGLELLCRNRDELRAIVEEVFERREYEVADLGERLRILDLLRDQRLAVELRAIPEAWATEQCLVAARR